MPEIDRQLYVDCLRLEAQLMTVGATARKAEEWQLAASIEVCRRTVGRFTTRYRNTAVDREEAQLEMLSVHAGRKHDGQDVA